VPREEDKEHRNNLERQLISHRISLLTIDFPTRWFRITYFKGQMKLPNLVGGIIES